MATFISFLFNHSSIAISHLRLIIYLPLSSKGSPAKQLARDQLLSLTCHSWLVLRDEGLITLELELTNSARVVSHSCISHSTLDHIELVFTHLHEVADRSDLLSDEVIDCIVLIIARESLDLSNDTSEASADISCQAALLTQVVEQLHELLEVASLRVPVLYLRGNLRKVEHQSINCVSSSTELLLSDELSSLALSQVCSKLQSFDQLNACAFVHVKR